MSKQFWKSKTLWVSVLGLLAGVITWATGQIEVGASITLSGLVMTGLRLMTDQGVEFFKK